MSTAILKLEDSELIPMGSLSCRREATMSFAIRGFGLFIDFRPFAELANRSRIGFGGFDGMCVAKKRPVCSGLGNVGTLDVKFHNPR
jgi:hypothetical protein